MLGVVAHVSQVIQATWEVQIVKDSSSRPTWAKQKCLGHGQMIECMPIKHQAEFNSQYHKKKKKRKVYKNQ
jgi:hypothetical protein